MLDIIVDLREHDVPYHMPYHMQDVLDSIVDLREHDVPYHVRFAIDTDVRCGHWFTVKRKVG
jgi:DNA polymerase elongation subunit (family B)